MLKVLALPPLATAAQRGEATEYATPAEVLVTVGRLEAQVAQRLRALGGEVVGAQSMVASFLRDQARHRGERARLCARWGLPLPTPAGGEAQDLLSLTALRQAQEALLYAHAEGLPALPDAAGVRTLARHMMDHSRLLTLIDLWLEDEAGRG